MRNNIRAIAAIGIATLTAPAAFAGGYIAPVEPEVIIAPEVQTVAPWAGFYAGGSIGGVFGGDDEVGFDHYNGGSVTARETDLTNLELSGTNLGLRAGYRWQRNKWVFGPELSYDFSNAESRAEAVVGDAYVQSELNNAITLRMKTGYLVRPDMMVYGSLGAVRGDFDYSTNRGVADQTVSYNKTGYTVGLGVERKMSERMSITGEWNYNHFGRTDVLFGTTDAGRETVATPSHHNIAIGLNFSF